LDVSECILKIKPDIFTNGGDRVTPNKKEEEACKQVGCVMSHGVGGYNKVLSSTQMLRDGLTYYRTWQMQNTCSFAAAPDPLGLMKMYGIKNDGTEYPFAAAGGVL
jgi:hypothetical protein